MKVFLIANTLLERATLLKAIPNAFKVDTVEDLQHAISTQEPIVAVLSTAYVEHGYRLPEDSIVMLSPSLKPLQIKQIAYNRYRLKD